MFVGNAIADEKLIYKKEWQSCKETSECIAVREGYNWTCVNRSYENEARAYCKNIDTDGTVDCHFVMPNGKSENMDARPSLPTPVCSQGKCLCGEIKKVVWDIKDQCKEDQDCMIIKLDQWESVNREDHEKRYYNLSGQACSANYRYPPPQSFCLKGICKSGDEKPIFLNMFNMFKR